MNDSKQRKLKRYWIDGGLCEMEPRGVFAECVHRIYLQDEADAVIFALEAENERMLDRVEFLVRHIHEDTPLQWVADELHAILQPSQSKDNREQENQQQLVEEKEQYKTVYTNLCRDLRAERARYIAILQSWKNFDVWAASTVRVPDGLQAVTDAHEELCMKRDAILNEQREKP